MNRDAELVRLNEKITWLRNELGRRTSTIFEPGDKLVWFDTDEVDSPCRQARPERRIRRELSKKFDGGD